MLIGLARTSSRISDRGVNNINNLSIIIPHYQKQDALTETLDELTLQIHPQDEIIIVDDHSPDGVPDCGCPCVRIVQPEKRTPHTYRLNTLRNFGLEYAKNDVTVILDPDCTPNPNFVKSTRSLFDPSVLFAGLIDFTEEDGSITPDPRGEKRNSRWTDSLDISSGMVWGGCMMFSRSRTRLFGWFDTDYDGYWGAEDHDFGVRCFHSGMRIRYEPKLSVIHQYHPKIPVKQRQEGYKRNLNLWREKLLVYATAFNAVTPYNPAVSVNVVILMRPYYIDPCIRSVFRSQMALKLYLVNQGDNSKEQINAINWWKNRWAVKYIYNEKIRPLPKIRNDVLLDAKKNKMKYHITLDDDATILKGSLETLVRVAEENPDYDAIAGYTFELPNKQRMLGGYVDQEKGIHYDIPRITSRDITEVEYLSTGFTLIRLKSLVLFDESYEYGWDDWDWSLMMREKGLKLGVCGKAGVTHRVLLTPAGIKLRHDPLEYKAIRYDAERNTRMGEIFACKWGYVPSAPQLLTTTIFRKLAESRGKR